ncbi:MAG: 16S rRNA (uracil(1498)-N(3))-methyltransferase [Deltaproteobacteria bacterium]
MRRFFIDRPHAPSDRVMLTGPDVRHIRTVLRLGLGDEILLFDDKGSEYQAQIIDTAPAAITVLILCKYSAISESHLEVTIGQALLRAQKMDRIVRQLTELGAFGFIPFMAERSVPKPNPTRLAEKRRRWETIAREALKQCGRFQPPRISPVVSFQDLVVSPPSHDLKIIFHTGQAAARPWTHLEPAAQTGKVLALVGPEGGFTHEEVKAAVDSGFACVSLGPRILKSDTAAVAAGAILQHAFGDMGRVQKCLDKD